MRNLNDSGSCQIGGCRDVSLRETESAPGQGAFPIADGHPSHREINKLRLIEIPRRVSYFSIKPT